MECTEAALIKNTVSLRSSDSWGLHIHIDFLRPSESTLEEQNAEADNDQRSDDHSKEAYASASTTISHVQPFRLS
ncbi:MAG: hypothetical protein KDJ40_12745 [Hyphomicrobiales bacterium]|nr:hypothetical protein [Hyphomicrobiales bacterium]MCO5086685.1 hypothetical protein [Methylobacteriaceae bacterium]